MMKFIVLALAFVCVAQGAPNQAASTPNIDDLVTNFNNVLAESASKIFGEDAVKQMKQNANDAAGEFNNFLKTVGDKVKELEPETKETVKKFQDKINEHLDSFKKENPEVAKSAKNIQDSLEQTIKKIVDESKQVEKTLKDNSSPIIQDIQKGLKEAIDGATKKAQELQKQLLEKKP